MSDTTPILRVVPQDAEERRRYREVVEQVYEAWPLDSAKREFLDQQYRGLRLTPQAAEEVERAYLREHAVTLLERLQQQLAASEQHVSALASEIASVQDQAQRKLADAELQADELRGQVVSAEARIATLETAQAEARTHAQHVLEELAASQARSAQLDARVAELEAKLASVEQQLATALKDNAVLTEDVNMARHEVRGLKAQLADAQHKIQRLKNHVDPDSPWGKFGEN